MTSKGAIRPRSLHFIALGLVVLALWIYNVEVVSFSKTRLYLTRGNVGGSDAAFAGLDCQQDHDAAALLNQTYGWFGNQFVPPPHVPLYSKQDMLKAFSEFDVLWIGDSTVRRAYATLYAILNSSSEDISVDELNHLRVIDVNRYAVSKGIIEEDSCFDQRATARREYLRPRMGDGMWSKESLCRKVATSRNISRSFDYVRAECYKDISQFSHDFAWDLQRYSLIIVGVGLHELVRERVCSVPLPRDKPTLEEQQLQEQVQGQSYTEAELNLIQQALRIQQGKSSTPKDMPAPQKLESFGLKGAQQMASLLQQTHEGQRSPHGVLWRTTGFSKAVSNETLQEFQQLNRQSVEWIHQQQPPNVNGTALTYVDWGGAIWPRSLPPNRIEGDIPAHYGLEARLLLAQMTTQQVVRLLKDFEARGY